MKSVTIDWFKLAMNCANAPIRPPPYEALDAATPGCVTGAGNAEASPVKDTPAPSICGQAPGLRVHESGIPFTDASGDRLRAWMGVTADEFYDATRVAIIPMGFCFPGYDAKGSDLPPRRECAPLWRDAVFARLPRLELMLAVGSYAIGWHLPAFKLQPMTTTVSAWQTLVDRPGITPAIIPLPHPSWRNTGWLKANPWFETALVPELQIRVRCLLQ